MGPIGCPELSVTTNIRCITSQNSEDLTYKNFRAPKLIFMTFFIDELYKNCLGTFIFIEIEQYVNGLTFTV
jgi:hypothetical protein